MPPFFSIVFIVPIIASIATFAWVAVTIHRLKQDLKEIQTKAETTLAEAIADDLLNTKLAKWMVKEEHAVRAMLDEVSSKAQKLEETLRATIVADVAAIKKEVVDGIATHSANALKNVEKAISTAGTAVCKDCRSIVAKFDRDADGHAHCVNCQHKKIKSR